MISLDVDWQKQKAFMMNDEFDLKIEKLKFYQDAISKIFELHDKSTNTQRLDWCQEQIIKILDEVKKL